VNDKELLELAAKAAGGLVYVEDMGWIREDADGNRGAWWNPLTDDGDRYRLIKKLEIEVNFKHQYAEFKDKGICICWPQEVKDDAYAVVAVAAEIGRMK